MKKSEDQIIGLYIHIRWGGMYVLIDKTLNYCFFDFKSFYRTIKTKKIRKKFIKYFRETHIAYPFITIGYTEFTNLTFFKDFLRFCSKKRKYGLYLKWLKQIEEKSLEEIRILKKKNKS